MIDALQQLPAWLGAVCTAVCASGQIETRAISVETEDGAARGWIATVDLGDPRVEVAALIEPADETGLVRLVGTDAWLGTDDLDLVVNANYFGARPGGVASIVGLCVADGEPVSPPRSYDGTGDPAVVFTRDGRAEIGLFASALPAHASCAVAGVGGSATSDLPGTALIDDGSNLGATARVQPMARHPRTALGVSRDGSRLTIAVIDGRQDGWSVGMTLPELADLLLAEDVWDAVNLDGGGSSAIAFRGPGGEVRTNRPSDGAARPVAVSLGIRISERAPAREGGGE